MRAKLEATSALSDVTRLVSELENSSGSPRTTRIGLSGNVTLDVLGTYLRKRALLHRLQATVEAGRLGDHLGNVERFASGGFDAIVLLDLFDARLPALEARLSVLGTEPIKELAAAYRAELTLALEAGAGIRDVFVARPHRMAPPGTTTGDLLDAAIALFDDAVVDVVGAHENAHLISTADICARLGWHTSHDVRSYERFRAPFAPAFMDAFAEEVYDATRAFGSYYMKALVLDGDGTLWGGILGEDLADGLKLDPFTYPGSMYWRMQHEFLALQQQGVLLCLCSKNEAGDVEALFASHPTMVLRSAHFVAKRVNWADKADSLEEIAAELNIGLDSIVFLDDSAFECDGIRSRLPMVSTLQVPADLSEYPRVGERLRRLFASNEQPVDSSKTEQYRVRALARAAKDSAISKDDYLASLQSTVTLRKDDRSSVARISELTQKSNQFNLTTRRYTVAQVEGMLAAEGSHVYSIYLADRHGDSGLTGVVITRQTNASTLAVDSFLLSCRVLGRGVESSIWDVIREDAIEAGCRLLVTEYLPTAKNGQVRDFWDQVGMQLVGEDEGGRREYKVDLEAMAPPKSPHLEVRRAF